MLSCGWRLNLPRRRKPHFPDIRPIAIMKFNPNHDPGGEGGGQFISGPGGLGEVDSGPGASTVAVGPTDEAKAYLKTLDENPKVQAARQEILDTPQTVDQHKVKGQYTPERTALHNKIIEEMLNPTADVPAGETPTATFLLGLPASGKSGVLKPHVANLDKATVTRSRPSCPSTTARTRRTCLWSRARSPKSRCSWPRCDATITSCSTWSARTRTRWSGSRTSSRRRAARWICAT
jgi:hypothetical protein